MTDRLMAQLETVRARRGRPGDCVPASIAALTGVEYDSLPVPDTVPWTRRDCKAFSGVSIQIQRDDWSNLDVFVGAYERYIPRWTSRYNRLLKKARAPIRLRFHQSPFTVDVALAGYIVWAFSHTCTGHMLLTRGDDVVFDPAELGPVIRTAPRVGWFEVVRV